VTDAARLARSTTMERQDLNHRLPAAVDALLANVRRHESLRRLNRGVLPSRENAAECVEKLLQLVFPGYYGRQGLTNDNLTYRIGQTAVEVADLVYDHVRFCLRYRQQARPGDADFDARCHEADREAAGITAAFLERIPDVRTMLADDVQAAFDADPAATSTDETIFSYPGLLAVTVQRLAHELYGLSVPLLPRIWTEIAHSRTGIDIHPGARLGRRFFIDHGTGVVIGETCTIGDGVKVYQGVTLGALAPAYGQPLRGTKRHPTIEDDVTIYAGATVLGGDTVIGRGCTIGGNVFLTASVPPNSVVLMEAPRLKVRERRRRSNKSDLVDEPNDFQI